jgi:asparagine synthase (glutamine-hydrolysing)
MPGIFGVVDGSAAGSSPVPELLDLLHRMAAIMRYDDDYAVDLVACPELGANVGRAGDLSDSDARSHASSSGALLTTGEPVVELPYDCGDAERRRLACVGRGSEELWRWLQSAGVEGLGDVEGAFAGCLIDPHAHQVRIFNDRCGIERLFVHQAGGRCFFASEAKAILAAVPETRAFDPQAVADTLGCGAPLGRQSLYRGIEVLAPASMVVFDRQAPPRQRAYFDRRSLEHLTPVTAGEFLDGFSGRLAAAVNRAARPGPASAVSLTGGLDSRMIMAVLDDQRGAVPCYTFGSMYRDSLDVRIARAVAARMACPFTVLTLGRPFLEGIREHFERAVFIADGYIGLSGAAELYVNRLAREIAPVRITGNWGGELLRGVRAFKYREPRADLLPGLRRELARSAEAFAAADRAFENPLSFVLFHQIPMQGYGRYAVERSQVQMRAPFLAPTVVDWLYQAPPTVRASQQCSTGVIARRPQLLAIPTDIGLLGDGTRLTRRLRRERRRVLVKAEYLLAHGAPDWIAALTRRGPGEQLEHLVIGYNKFQHFRRWIRRELAPFVRESLSSAPGDLDGFFELSAVRRTAEAQISGTGNALEELDLVLTLAAAARAFFRPAPDASREMTNTEHLIEVGA